ncbi:MAG TPA: SDR family NAD(P)-dependent oxidoreductase [Caulobacteraceae bacterium]|jgi:NAD(P)-dependent dehydrogenase (short-subunit alcohol dehydrogenase family)|nr:SDR family NAD(P)-dependent oxidoreductase [Caulobacteraceae bacterium]
MPASEGAHAPAKVIVVTGASTGMGRGIAVAAARAGMRAVIGDITEAARGGNFDERPELTTQALIEAEGGEALFVTCDVGAADEASALIAAAVERFGRLDVLVNNAGVWRGGRFHEIPEAAFDACWNVIAKGSWLVSQAAVRHFLRQGEGGCIINVVSTAGLRGHYGQASYNVAKAAQSSLTRVLALEYGHAGIRVNAICPTNVKTAMSRGGYDREPYRDGINRGLALGRWGEVSDVVDLAMFLASDAASFITGVLVPLDGGETLGFRRT